MLNKELTSAINNNSLSHAYIFYDEDQAFEFANSLNVLPADFLVQEELLTKPIEELQASLKIKPFGDLRLVLIKNADNMAPIVQNKLLKTLEEPLGNTIIILSAKRRDAFLQTILSRCVEIASPDKSPEISEDANRIAELFYKAEPLFFKRKSIVSEIETKELALSFLDALENLLREELLKTLDKELCKKINMVEDTRKSISSGFSASFALKALSLDM